MNILKKVLQHEVFPALGCTEPISVAYAASIAGRELDDEVEKISITVDPGVFKNGFAVTIPNTDGERGNLFAGVLGALIKQPDLKMELLKSVEADMINKAKSLIRTGKATISYDTSKKNLFIEVTIKSGGDSVRAVLANSHMNLVHLAVNNRVLFEKEYQAASSGDQDYKQVLKKMRITEFIDLAKHLDQDDYRYIEHGIEMNLAISKEGIKLRKIGFYLSDLMEKGYLLNDVFSSSKILTASATDARMAGLNFPVMASGGSGNQGIVAILVPYNVGIHFNIDEEKIVQSIALSHLINSYTKCFTGDLSPLCGCAIAAGVGAAVAIVYQQCGHDMKKITLAVNNLISDLGGMLCDGAKGGCALKAASSTDSAIRSAYMALNEHGISHMEGFVGETAEETIRHLSEISNVGMAGVDDTMLGIMMKKNAATV